MNSSRFVRPSPSLSRFWSSALCGSRPLAQLPLVAHSVAVDVPGRLERARAADVPAGAGARAAGADDAAGLAGPLRLTARARGTGQRHGYRGARRAGRARRCTTIGDHDRRTVGTEDRHHAVGGVATSDRALGRPAVRRRGLALRQAQSRRVAVARLPTGGPLRPAEQRSAQRPHTENPRDQPGRDGAREPQIAHGQPAGAARGLAICVRQCQVTSLPRALSASSKGCFSFGAIIFERFRTEMDERSTY